MDFFEKYQQVPLLEQLENALSGRQSRVRLSGVSGSYGAVVSAAFFLKSQQSQLFVATGKEEAYYVSNDLDRLLGDEDKDITSKQVLLFPTTYRKAYSAGDDGNLSHVENANELQRTEVIKQLSSGRRLLVVTYPEALVEKVVSKRMLQSNSFTISKDSTIDVDELGEMLQRWDFERVDFVIEPGQYAIRGGIVDVYSYANDLPFRIELFDDQVDSLRAFDPVSQLSVRHYEQVSIVPPLHAQKVEEQESYVSLLQYFDKGDTVWVQGLGFVCEQVDKVYASNRSVYQQLDAPERHVAPDLLFSTANDFLHQLLDKNIVELGNAAYFTKSTVVSVACDPQPPFNKQFDLLVTTLQDYLEKGYDVYVTVSNEQQLSRLKKIFGSSDMSSSKTLDAVQFTTVQLANGFVDHDSRTVCFTDHQIFERYHKYSVRDLRQNREAMTIKELTELKPGDFVTHIDHGVGRFSGLEKIDVNGRLQEVIRLVYKNNDTLYISIHSLHKISRYVGKEGTVPALDRLGSSRWQIVKQRTKKQVKDIAKDLIALYAKRKATKGFAYTADSYLQNELEASFLYEDTPDQHKATAEVKRDMESQSPMDRLICGDVGFGKTEIAIRAAFKAVCDSKQVAVLVPSTILAFQHYNTFTQRLKNFPVRVDYLNRFRTTKEKSQIYRDLESGKIDILVGTHAITNKNLKFKDLGLLIVDEEQKFGVAMKEKLRQMKVNVDSLTLTATPIPRTLQFSLMGARDLSVIQTPPPNRQPVDTTLCPFSEEVIRDAVAYEMSRGGQTFFVSNRVENLPEMAGLVQRLAPDARVAMAHGQMDGKQVEDILMQFLQGEIDVLVATAIVENGLDIPNANTMIVNNAQNFGLSDLHQMRGRVGRSNKKAFCYMLVPSFTAITGDAQKRLRAIEEFSTIGSGFNIAMRDLDIRGAGNILGAEQSGFISEIGYDMYHKILNEAIQELKMTDFHDLFALELEQKKEYVSDCAIETDLEAMFPDDYVTSISERLLLYKQLSDITTDEQVDDFREHLIDRFGPLPTQAQELLMIPMLRQSAKAFGIEKMVLKNARMTLCFVSDTKNPFYNSANVAKVIAFAKKNPRTVRIKESLDRFSMTVDNVDSVRRALEVIGQLDKAADE